MEEVVANGQICLSFSGSLDLSFLCSQRSKMMRNVIKFSLMEMTAAVGLSQTRIKKKMPPGGPSPATHVNM